MIKILFVLGTRPEAIKLAPLIKFFKEKDAVIESKVCITAQHREMLDEVFDFFSIKPEYDLNVMTPGQSLAGVTGKCITGIDEVLNDYQPDIVFVQGDTTTAFSAALAAFYRKIKIAHVEAGLRSGNRYSPFPEEINRVFVSKITDFHFAPTNQALLNLQNEGIVEGVWNVGNTVIDALLEGDKILKENSSEIADYFTFLSPDKKVILLTSHRRENFGEPLLDICKVVKRIVEKYNDVEIVYPVHPNPNVKKIVEIELGGLERIHLISPLSYPYLLYLMQRSYLILTDSGGIQEEAPSLGKPIVVLRDVTERMEGVEAGTALMGGNAFESIWHAIIKIMDSKEVYDSMSNAVNPYGDGKTSERIFNIIMGCAK